ncbi:Trimethylguanosine synthase [Gonapodya sp. JEL0774]|nr:Trimethylguanosine synthase [Gonapodya sp. JEL0774]
MPLSSNRYSVTPEAVGRYIADRCAGVVDSRKGEGASSSATVIDAFCGTGGNAIQFAARFARVIAIDIDELKLQCASENARIYGVTDRIEFIHGNCLDIIPTLTHPSSIIFLSPPWGGPSYQSQSIFDLSSITIQPPRDSPTPVNGFDLVRRFLPPRCGMCVFYVPRNVDEKELSRAMAHNGTVPLDVDVEVERVWLNGREKVALGIAVSRGSEGFG